MATRVHLILTRRLNVSISPRGKSIQMLQGSMRCSFIFRSYNLCKVDSDFDTENRRCRSAHIWSGIENFRFSRQQQKRENLLQPIPMWTASTGTSLSDWIVWIILVKWFNLFQLLLGYIVALSISPSPSPPSTDSASHVCNANLLHKYPRRQNALGNSFQNENAVRDYDEHGRL